MAKTMSGGLNIDAVLQSVFGAVKNTMQKVGQTTENLTRRQQRLGQILGQAFPHPTRKFLTESVGQSATFQDGIRDIAINSNLNASDENILANVIRDVAQRTNNEVNSLNSSIGRLLQQGISVGEIGTYAEQIGQLSAGLRFSTTESTSILLSLRDMGVRDSDTMQQVLDQLIWAGQQDTLGAKGMMQSILQLHGERQQPSSSHKVDFNEFIGRVGLSNALQESKSGLDHQQQPQQSPAQQGSKSSAATGSLQRLFDLRMTSPLEQFKSLNLAVTQLSISLGNLLLPVVMPVVNTLTSMVNVVNSLVQDYPNLTLGIIGAALAFRLYKTAVVGTNISMFDLLKNPLPQMRTAFGKLGRYIVSLRPKILVASMALGNFSQVIPKIGTAVSVVGRVFAVVGRSLLLNPIGLIITGIALTAMLIYKYWDPIAAFFTGVFDGMREALSPFIDVVKSVFDGLAPIFKPIINIFATIWDWCKKLFQPFEASQDQLEGVTSAGRTFGKVLGTVINIIFTPLKYLFKIIAGVVNAIVGLFSWSPTETIKAAWGGITGFVSSTWEKNSALISSSWDSISSTVSDGVDDVVQRFKEWSPLQDIKNAWSGIKDLGGSLCSDFMDGLKSRWEVMKSTVLNLGNSVKDWFTETLGINSPSKVFIGYGENVVEGAAIGIDSQTNMVSNAVKGLAIASAISLAHPALASHPTDFLNQRPAQMIYAPDSRAVAAATAPQSNGMVLHFAPNITINSEAGELKSQINNAMKISFAEFERLMKQYQHHTQRVVYKGIGK